MGVLNFMSFEELNNKINPHDSGVYLIADHNDKIVYVGKAFKIKSRVLSHFNGYSNTKDYFNTVSVQQGYAFQNIKLHVKHGKIIEAYANDTERINRILDTDKGARYIGEFALAF